MTDPEITTSFRADGPGFISCNGGGFISCPPYVIATTAQQVQGLTLPDGYDTNTLARIRCLTGFVGQDVLISGRQGEELADMGLQILEAADRGEIKLGFYQRQSIQHLLNVVHRAH